MGRAQGEGAKMGLPIFPNAFLPLSMLCYEPCSKAECLAPLWGGNKAKQSSPGSKYYLDTKERYVTLYGSRISAF